MVNIYLLRCPISFEVRYVGKTIKSLNKRLTDHLYAKNKSHRTSWIKSLLNKGLKPTIELIEEVEDSVWIEREQFWIRYYKDLGEDLCNHTIGGEGHAGYKATEETKRKMSKSRKGKKLKPHSEEERQRISQGIKEYRKSLGIEHQMIGGNRDMKGSNSNCAKLNEDKVKEIRLLLEEGKTIYKIAEIYKVNPTTISCIKRRKTWTHVN